MYYSIGDDDDFNDNSDKEDNDKNYYSDDITQYCAVLCHTVCTYVRTWDIFEDIERWVWVIQRFFS